MSLLIKEGLGFDLDLFGTTLTRSAKRRSLRRPAQLRRPGRPNNQRPQTPIVIGPPPSTEILEGQLNIGMPGTPNILVPYKAPGRYNLGIEEIAQGMMGTCPILSGLAGMPYEVLSNGNYRFEFRDRLTGMMPQNITLTPFIHASSSKGVSGLIERAYTYWLQVNGLVAPGRSAWNEMSDGDMVATVLRSQGRTPQIYRYLDGNLIGNALVQGQVVTVGNEGPSSSNYPIGNHAYRVQGISADRSTVRLFNPWGKDGGRLSYGNPNDGIIDISVTDLRTSFGRLEVTIG